MTDGVVHGRGAYPGISEGAALVTEATLTGWDTFDKTTGAIKEPGHPLQGQRVAGRVLVIGGARGSTGWGTQFLRLRVAGLAPAAMVFPVIDSRTAAACVVTKVPAVADLDEDIFTMVHTGDRLRVDGHRGVITVLQQATAG